MKNEFEYLDLVVHESSKEPTPPCILLLMANHPLVGSRQNRTIRYPLILRYTVTRWGVEDVVVVPDANPAPMRLECVGDVGARSLETPMIQKFPST
jgi:hypothetical protein